MVNVSGFPPYFYIPSPRGFENSDLGPLKEALNVRLLPYYVGSST